MTTYTKRTNAKRAAIKAGIPDEQVEITVQKKGGEVRFGFKQKEAAPAPVVITTPAPVPAPVLLSAVTTADRETRNNVRRPAPGGKCAAVWDALDQMHAANVDTNAGSVADLAMAKNWSLGNAQTELYQWRKWMGLSKARAPKEKKPKGAAKAAPPATLVDGSVDQYVA